MERCLETGRCDPGPGRRVEEAVRRSLRGPRPGYGSYTRGEAIESSDVDLLLLLEGQVRAGTEIRRTSELVASLSLESARSIPDPGERRGLQLVGGPLPGQCPPRGHPTSDRRLSGDFEVLPGSRPGSTSMYWSAAEQNDSKGPG